MTSLAAAPAPVGELLRGWRERRRLSQLELSLRAEVSARHLSFVETGRSRPTAQMILHLARHLEVPLRERNELLLAGGFAPAYPQRSLDDVELGAVRSALAAVLAGHGPHPALLLDRWWQLLDANAAAARLLDGCAPRLLEPPVNVLRVSLHPDGLAPRIANLGQWRAHLLSQVEERASRTGDPALAELAAELRAYPAGPASAAAPTDVVVPLVLDHPVGRLDLFSMASRVETATDVTVEELSVEAFFPADGRTAERLAALAGP